MRDRLEIVEFSSYTREERIELAKRFLLPKQIIENGLTIKQVKINDDALDAIIDHYTFEAGVRELERQIATLCRKVARSVVEKPSTTVTIDLASLSKYLGLPRYRLATQSYQDEVGTATGLVVSYGGGDVVTIEVSLLESLSELPQFTLTGNLGDIMKESAQTAATYIRSIRETIAPNSSPRVDVHVHVPEGAIQKDGPSAGITIAVALASAFSGRAVRGDLAMTGEVTLRGKILGIGGLREKALAAQRCGIKHVIFPKDNANEIATLPESTRKALTFHPVETVREALDFALCQPAKAVIVTESQVAVERE